MPQHFQPPGSRSRNQGALTRSGDGDIVFVHDLSAQLRVLLVCRYLSWPKLVRDDHDMGYNLASLSLLAYLLLFKRFKYAYNIPYHSERLALG